MLPGENFLSYCQLYCLHRLAWAYLRRVCFSLGQISCICNYCSIWVLPNPALLEAMRAMLIPLTNEFWHQIRNSDLCLCGSLISNYKNHCTIAFYTNHNSHCICPEDDYIFISQWFPAPPRLSPSPRQYLFCVSQEPGEISLWLSHLCTFFWASSILT